MKPGIFLLFIATAFAQDGIVRLEKWRVQLGDDPAWAAPAFDDTAWEASSWPRRYTSVDTFYAGTRWYRTTSEIPAKLAGHPLAIGVGPLDELFDIYVEGVRIGGLGDWEPTPTGRFPRHVSFAIPEKFTHQRLLHIALRRWTGRTATNYNVMVYNGILNSVHAPEFGASALIATREQYHGPAAALSYILNPLFCGLVAIVGILSLVLFLGQRSRRENLWLGVTLVCQGVPPVAGLWLAATDWPVRSLSAGVIVGLNFLMTGMTCLFLATICPRLATPLRLTGAILSAHAMLRIPSYVFQMELPGYEAQRFNASPLLLLMTACLATAGVLFFQDRQRHATLLATSLVLIPAAHFWVTTRITVWLGMEAARFPTLGAFSIDPRNVAHLLFALLALTGLYLRLREDQARQAVLDRDLSAARLIQSSLIDSGGVAAEGFIVDTAYLPASEVGGDFYQTIAGDDGSLLLVTGDVSGKGLPASLLVAAVVGALGDLASREPAEVLEHLNRTLRGKTRGGFVTCICALFHRDGRVTLANAGQIAPYIDGREVEMESGLPLGIVPDAIYLETSMHTNEALTFVSDGVIEAANPAGELYGFERTRQISGKSAQEITEAARQWGQNDDITVVTVQRTGRC